VLQGLEAAARGLARAAVFERRPPAVSMRRGSARCQLEVAAAGSPELDRNVPAVVPAAVPASPVEGAG
jgi:hypothetical protein